MLAASLVVLATCAPPASTRDLDYGFLIDGFQKQDGPRTTFRLTRAHRGKHISCTAYGATIAGRGGAPGTAPPRVVRSSKENV